MYITVPDSKPVQWLTQHALSQNAIFRANSGVLVSTQAPDMNTSLATIVAVTNDALPEQAGGQKGVIIAPCALHGWAWCRTLTILEGVRQSQSLSSLQSTLNVSITSALGQAYRELNLGTLG